MSQETCEKCDAVLFSVPYKGDDVKLILNNVEADITQPYCIFCNDVRIKKGLKTFKYNSFGQIVCVAVVPAKVKAIG